MALVPSTNAFPKPEPREFMSFFPQPRLDIFFAPHFMTYGPTSLAIAPNI